MLLGGDPWLVANIARQRSDQAPHVLLLGHMCNPSRTARCCKIVHHDRFGSKDPSWNIAEAKV